MTKQPTCRKGAQPPRMLPPPPSVAMIDGRAFLYGPEAKPLARALKFALLQRNIAIAICLLLIAGTAAFYWATTA